MKVQRLSELYKQSIKLEGGSLMRTEIATEVAVLLRATLCYSGGESLLKKCAYEECKGKWKFYKFCV